MHASAVPAWQLVRPILLVLLFMLITLSFPPSTLPVIPFPLPLTPLHPHPQVEIRIALAEELPRRLSELEAALTKTHADRMAAREAEFGAESDRRMQDLERTLMQQVLHD